MCSQICNMKNLNLKVFRNWEFFVVIGLPILLLPLLFIPDDDIIGEGPNAHPSTKFKCAFVLLLMAAFWMIEALPLAITSLLPMVLLPLLGVQGTAKVSIHYMTDTNMMFVGGLIIALAVEYCNLHRRMALKVMTTVGSSPTRMMFGLMLVTMFLSMWMSNTATAAMVVPIAMAVLEELHPKPDQSGRRRRPSMFKERSEVDFEALVAKAKAHRSKVQIQNQRQQHMHVKMDPEPGEGTKFIRGMDFEMEMEDTEALKRKNVKKMLLFSVCLAANIGGTGVITGTASNLVFQGLINDEKMSQGGKYVDMTFATWMAYAILPMLVNTFISWLYLVIVFYGVPDWVFFWRKENKSKQLQSQQEIESQNRVAKVLEEKYKALGKMSFHEIAVFVLFILIVVLWLFREPRFMPGWAEHVSSVEIRDSTAALFVVLLLFIIPRDLGTFFGMGDKANVTKTPPLLDWKYVQLNLPWGVIILMGGGFALSNSVEYSGLSAWLGKQLNAVNDLPHPLILVVVVLVTAGLTEVASNTACATVIIPILISLSKTLDIHPLYLTMPATIACSYAFLLPVATPPNAIVFAAGGGDISIMEMVKTMLFPNCICIVIMLISHVSYGNLIFSFDDYEYPLSLSLASNLTAGVS